MVQILLYKIETFTSVSRGSTINQFWQLKTSLIVCRWIQNDESCLTTHSEMKVKF